MTIAKTKPTSTETVDVARLSHLNAHPLLRPLFDRRGEIRERLHGLEEDIKEQRRALAAVRDDTNVSGVGARREAQDRLTSLEREVAASEAALHSVQGELETAQDAVKDQLSPPIAAEGVLLVAELLNALERLVEVSARYGAYAQRSRRVLNTPVVPQWGIFTALPALVKEAHRVLERLQRLAGEHELP